MKSLILACLALVTGCGASTQVTAATAANGDQFPFCFEVSQPLLSFRANLMICASTAMALEDRKVEAMKLYPGAKLMPVAAK